MSDQSLSVNAFFPLRRNPRLFFSPGKPIWELVGDPVGRGPQALVEGLVGVADQGGVGVGVLHQGGGGGQLQGG